MYWGSLLGKSMFYKSGDTLPRRAGPKITPAKISPAKAGIFMDSQITPRVRATPRRTRICTIKSRIWLSLK